MKNCNVQLGFFALIMLTALAICSCSEVESEFQDYSLQHVITPDGGTLIFFDGDMKLTFQRGTVSHEIEFTATMCLDEKECNFMIRPVRIEPLMQFSNPVNVVMRYDGMLGSSENDIPENVCLMATIWKSDADFLNNESFTNCVCTMDRERKTLEFCICNTGIITIGLPR